MKITYNYNDETITKIEEEVEIIETDNDKTLELLNEIFNL